MRTEQRIEVGVVREQMKGSGTASRHRSQDILYELPTSLAISSTSIAPALIVSTERSSHPIPLPTLALNARLAGRPKVRGVILMCVSPHGTQVFEEGARVEGPTCVPCYARRGGGGVDRQFPLQRVHHFPLRVRRGRGTPGLRRGKSTSGTSSYHWRRRWSNSRTVPEGGYSGVIVPSTHMPHAPHLHLSNPSPSPYLLPTHTHVPFSSSPASPFTPGTPAAPAAPSAPSRCPPHRRRANVSSPSSKSHLKIRGGNHLRRTRPHSCGGASRLPHGALNTARRSTARSTVRSTVRNMA